jgi:hypothetical protein
LSLQRTVIAALSRRRNGSPMEPLPKSKAQMVLLAFEVSVFIFFSPLFCAVRRIVAVAEAKPPANNHFCQHQLMGRRQLCYQMQKPPEGSGSVSLPFLPTASRCAQSTLGNFLNRELPEQRICLVLSWPILNTAK